MKFVIVSGFGYNGGNLVLHRLASSLNERGHSAKIFFFYRKKDFLVRPSYLMQIYLTIYWNLYKVFRAIAAKFALKKEIFFMKTPHFQQKYIPVVDDDTIVVYGDTVYGNPLRAKKIVRWFLYHNRFPNKPEAYGKDELVFSYREHFNDYNLNPSCRLLTLNHFDKELYKQTNFGERNGVCYIIRKGKNRPDLPKHFDGPIIDNLTEKEKVTIFNKCKFCYDYDTQTFYSTIAAVCGCIPIVVMEQGKSKSDYLGEGDSDYGRAYGDTLEEIERAIKTRQQCLQMLDFEESNQKNVDFFIKTVSEYFAEK